MWSSHSCHLQWTSISASIQPSMHTASPHICSHPSKSYLSMQASIYEDKHTSILATINHSPIHPPTHQCIDPSKHLWTHPTNYPSIQVINIHPLHATINHPPIHACISPTLASTHVSMELSIHPSTHLPTYYLLLLPPFPTVWLPHIKVPYMIKFYKYAQSRQIIPG